MESVTAGDTEIPALGFGTFQLSGTNCRRAVRTALDSGYRHIDTAEYYDNESAVGDAIEASSVDRDDLFLTTKVWRSNLHHDDVITAAEASLQRLGTSYVDLLLVHWPHPRVPVEETLAAMEQLRKRGLVRHIGVSNFTRSQLSEVNTVAESNLVCNQVLYHPYKKQDALRAYCEETGTALTAYSPLARGSVLDDQTLTRIGNRYDKTTAQVTLRWLVQQPQLVAIPRSSTPEHIRANAAVFDFELTAEEMQDIHDLSGGISIRIRNRLPAVMRSFPL